MSHHKLQQLLQDVVMLLRLTRMYIFRNGCVHAKLTMEGMN